MQPRILLIEDEQAIADAVVYALSTEGFQTDWFATSAHGLEAFRKNAYGFLILDVGLPDGSGFDLCKEVRKTSKVPILFLTARAGEVDRIVGLEIGADDFVAKPFSPRELTARVKAILRRTAPGNEKTAATTPFQIDDNKMSATYFGKVLTLTRYEYRLLKVLVDKPGWVYSREQLLQLVWDEPEMSLDRTVDAHVKSLRAKLKEIRADLDPIRTHRGSGYSLKEDL